MEKYLHEISMVTFTNLFSQAYLILASKLDVPKIGIPLSKWTQYIPCNYLVYLHERFYERFIGLVSPIMDPLHFVFSSTLCSSFPNHE